MVVSTISILLFWGYVAKKIIPTNADRLVGNKNIKTEQFLLQINKKIINVNTQSYFRVTKFKR